MSSAVAKMYVTYDEVHILCQKIAADVQASEWKPDCMVAIAGGGLIPSRILRAYLQVPVYVVGFQRYEAGKEVSDSVPRRIQWLDNPQEQLYKKNVLLVDEVDDTRVTLEYCTQELLEYTLSSLRIAVLHQKQKDKAGILPAAVQHTYAGAVIGNEWINYPWEATDIDEHNRLAKAGSLA